MVYISKLIVLQYNIAYIHTYIYTRRPRELPQANDTNNYTSISLARLLLLQRCGCMEGSPPRVSPSLTFSKHNEKSVEFFFHYILSNISTERVNSGEIVTPRKKSRPQFRRSFSHFYKYAFATHCYRHSSIAIHTPSPNHRMTVRRYSVHRRPGLRRWTSICNTAVPGPSDGRSK